MAETKWSEQYEGMIKADIIKFPKVRNIVLRVTKINQDWWATIEEI